MLLAVALGYADVILATHRAEGHPRWRPVQEGQNRSPEERSSDARQKNKNGKAKRSRYADSRSRKLIGLFGVFGLAVLVPDGHWRHWAA
jgi:hypothetical protein